MNCEWKRIAEKSTVTCIMLKTLLEKLVCAVPGIAKGRKDAPWTRCWQWRMDISGNRCYLRPNVSSALVARWNDRNRSEDHE
ncbi:MAG TPA: hypothetical protein ENN68_04685 [Methanomicrobia archaeon]|mgnify:CR=1 FL=1|nr:hypothetical protein [Methanomicrobia archaeon]